MTTYRRKWDIDISSVCAEAETLEKEAYACFERIRQYIEWDYKDGTEIGRQNSVTWYALAEHFMQKKKMIVVYTCIFRPDRATCTEK